MARPNLGNCTKEQEDRWKRAAAADDRPFSSWARRALDKQARQDLGENAQTEKKIGSFTRSADSA